MTFRQRLYDALIDSGSELSFVNAELTWRAEALGYQIRDQCSTVHLANNSPIEVPGAIKLPVCVGNKRFLHQFLVMPALKTPMLIDFWVKIRVALEPPSRNHASRKLSVEVYSVGLSPQTTDERRRLQAFLEWKLPKFESVEGPTDKINTASVWRRTSPSNYDTDHGIPPCRRL